MAKKKVFQIGNALTEGLEETVTAAHNYNGELRVEVISLKKIELDPENPRDLILSFDDLLFGLSRDDKNYSRKVDEKNSLLSLANSIHEQGLINPIIVYKHGDKYRLVAGERRTLSSILAGKSDIQAKILDRKPDNLKISLLQWMENVERKDLSLYERLKNLEKIIISYGQSDDDITSISPTNLAKLLGCSVPHAMNYCAVLKADKQVQDLVHTNQIKNLEKAALIASIHSKEAKKSAIEACLMGATLKKLKSISALSKINKPATIKPTKPKTQGRAASRVNLGSTRKAHVARVIANSVLLNDKFTHLNAYFMNLDWSDYKAVNHAFRQLVKSLESIEA